MKMEVKVIGNRYSGFYMLGKPLPRSLCDGRLLVLCM